MNTVLWKDILLYGDCHCFHTIFYLKFMVDALDMTLHGFDADIQGMRNFLIALTLDDGPENFLFTVSQNGILNFFDFPVRTYSRFEVQGQVHQIGGDCLMSLKKRLYDPNQFSNLHTFEHVAVGARLHGAM